MVIKYVYLLKRNPKLTFEEFIEYYETKHRLIGIEHVPQAIYYSRRYLKPMGNAAVEGYTLGEDFDAITEQWFPDAAAQEQAMKHAAKPDITKLIVDDEEQLFDRSRSRFFVVVEEHADSRVAP
jgi:hypothetical protein